MHIISSENIIASHMNNTKSSSIKQETVSDIKKTLIKDFKNIGICVYIDTTRDSLMHTINTSPDLFELDNKKHIISCKNMDKLENETRSYFDTKVPREIRDQYKKFMEKISKKPIS